MSRTEAIKRLVAQKRVNIAAKVKSKEFQTRVKTGVSSILVTGAVSTIPIWIIERNKDYKYLDEAKEIETEAVLAGVGLLAGLGAYLMDVDDMYSTPALVGGCVMAGNYISEQTRQRAREELLEEEALAAQQAAQTGA